MNHQVIAQSRAEAVIEADWLSVDLTEWVFTLTDSEYQACSKNHIAAGSSRTPEGKRMSINVEHVGNLMIQHYVEDVSMRNHCRLISLSDSIGPSVDGRVQVVVIWEFQVEALSDTRTKFINRVEVQAADGYLEALAKRGVSFAQASQVAQGALSAHNAEETPLFARDIERKAKQGRWG